MTSLLFQETAILSFIQKFNTQTSLYQATITASFISLVDLIFTPSCREVSLIQHLLLLGPFPASHGERHCVLWIGAIDYVMTTGTTCSLQMAHSNAIGTTGCPLAMGTCFNMLGITKPASLVRRCNKVLPSTLHQQAKGRTIIVLGDS